MWKDNKTCKCVRCGKVYVQDTALYICKDCRNITRNKYDPEKYFIFPSEDEHLEQR